MSGKTHKNHSIDSVPARKNPWLAIGTGITTVVVLAGAIYGIRQWQDSQELKAIKTLAQARNYEECVTQGQKITQGSTSYTNAQTLLMQCKAGVIL